MFSDCVVVGGGLTGLSTAWHMVVYGLPVRLVEALPDLGGRTRSYRIDGFVCNQTLEPVVGGRPEACILDYTEYVPLTDGLIVRDVESPRFINADPLPVAGIDFRKSPPGCKYEISRSAVGPAGARRGPSGRWSVPSRDQSSRGPIVRSCQPRPSPLGSGRIPHTVLLAVP